MRRALCTRLSLRLVILGLFVAMTGCAGFDYREPDRPQPLTKIEPLSPRPGVALVLGSGGPRGYAHIGIMRVLEEEGIKVDLVVGSSVGSLLGAFWADGYSAREISALGKSGGPLTLFDFSLFADRGWIHGQRLQNYVNDRLRSRVIEQMPRRLIIAATRRSDKAPVFFSSGNAGVAVRASSAIPRIISPVGIEGVEYEDADESLPVAVSAARQAGARFIIAIDVSARAGSAPPGTSGAWLERDAKRRSRIDPEVAGADLVLHPDLGYEASPSRAYFEKAEAIGEATARAMLPMIRLRLAENGLGGAN